MAASPWCAFRVPPSPYSVQVPSAFQIPIWREINSARRRVDGMFGSAVASVLGPRSRDSSSERVNEQARREGGGVLSHSFHVTVKHHSRPPSLLRYFAQFWHWDRPRRVGASASADYSIDQRNRLREALFSRMGRRRITHSTRLTCLILRFSNASRD